MSQGGASTIVSGGGGGGALNTLSGNTGIATPVSNNIGVVTARSTATFVGAGSLVILDFGTPANLLIGQAGTSITSATANYGFGSSLGVLTTGIRNVGMGITFSSLNTGNFNTAIGYNNQVAITNQTDNTSVGYLALQNCTSNGNTAFGSRCLTALTANTGCAAVGLGAGVSSTGSNSTFMGYQSANFLTTGNNNSMFGCLSGRNLSTGASNLFLGFSAGIAYTTSESSNICIANDGVIAESNTIRVGKQGAGAGQQNRCFIAGITGVTTSNSQMVTIDTTTGQLGSAATITSNTGNSAIASGSAVSLTTAINANVTSISLAAGTWSVSALTMFGGAPTVTGVQQASISTTSATHGALGNNSAQSAWATGSFSLGNVSIAIPSYILVLASTTTVYMVASGVFSGGTMTAYGRITAIRIA